MIRKEQIYLYVVSLLLSLLLWAQVNIQNEQVKEKEFTVPIDYRQVSPNQIALTSTDLVSVVIAGKSAQVDRIESRDVRIFANLAGKKLGDHVVKLMHEELPDGVDIQLKRQEVSVSLEQLESISRQVEIDPIGSAPASMVFERAVGSPSIVTISGPKSMVEKVRKVRAIYDLANMRIGVSQEQKLEALDKNGEPIRLIKFEPVKVEVTSVAASGPMVKSMIVVAKFIGQPAFGYNIKGYELSSVTVNLSGTNEALRNIQTIETELIDLTGLKADKSIEVKLKLPENLQFGPSTENKVKVIVRVVSAQ